MIPLTHVQGDARHGVNRYARTLATHLPHSRADRSHVHFTDRLWGATPDEAARRFEAHARATPTTVTLHDVPQPADGAPRRVHCYRRVARAARAVACSSLHERTLLQAITEATAHVIPHYVERLPESPAPPCDGSIAVLGFIYPGKGHAEVIDAVARLASPRPPVIALGSASDRHAPDVAALAVRAAGAAVDFRVTGYLDDAELPRRLRAAAVPVAAHRHISASGSIATWIAAGRRPLVPGGPYARELPPGTVTPYGDLTAALAAALADPASTWRAPGVDPGPDERATARAYARWWERLAW